MKTIKVILAGVGVAVVLLIFVPIPMGKGNMRYARKWKQRLDRCVTLADVTNNFQCLDVTGRNIGWSTTGDRLILLTFTNGNWIVLRCANSHENPWGGTLVTRDSTGKTRVFFGHVCGAETLRGNSFDEAYSNLISHMDRREVFIARNEGIEPTNAAYSSPATGSKR